MDTNIKILIGVVVVIILLIIGILVYKHRENFNNETLPTPSENFYNYLHYLYHAINQILEPDFYNSDRTTDITQCKNIAWPPSIRNEITIDQLNKVYGKFKSDNKDAIAKVIRLYLSTDSVEYTKEYNKLVNVLMNMSIPDPNNINITRLDAYIVLTASPDISDKLIAYYGNGFAKLNNFVQQSTPL